MPERTALNPLWLAALGCDLGHPAVRLRGGRLIEAGSEAWTQVNTLAPSERVELLQALRMPILSATPAGRERLNQWRAHRAARRATRAESPAALRQRLWNRLAFQGDLAMLPSVVEALATLPAAIREPLARDVAFIGIGWATGGATFGADLHLPDGHRPSRIAVISGASRSPTEVGRLVRHELGHTWARSPHVGPADAGLAIGLPNVLALAAREGWSRQAMEYLDRDERLAIAFEIVFNLAFRRGAVSATSEDDER